MTHPDFSFNTTAEEVATIFAAQIRGKNVLITGTSLNGIGFETARVLAKHANLVIITGHNSNRLKLAEETIKRELPSANIRPLILDLSSLSSVRKAAAEVDALPEPLHVIIHNAAATIGLFTLTVDNLESQIATDHISPFLFTKLLAPKLLAARTAHYIPRVVFVSSVGHGLGTGAKAANVLCAIELSKRSGGQINAYSLHPGAIYTNITQKGEGIAGLQKLGYLDSDGLPSNDKEFKTMGQGAATTVAAALDPRLDDTPGAYLADCVVENELVAPHCLDSANAERLWTMTEEIIGEKFAF
ncbi:hypothetical protein DFH08DRAFT_1003112 [Mycena albidolilacea]|uniref:NAD(P)-binding protein n=1 Tax=Mycena albidolilacea TaxID=1033008 RepID=A0AAD7F560_9AGAR|nr:hypothetical protein DFH08DRAFT_1003112 [Mycena albidolilacea]